MPPKNVKSKSTNKTSSDAIETVAKPDYQANLHEENSSILLSLFESGNFSDCIIRCKEKEWKVHRFVICKRSSFFERALNGSFREASTNIVDLSHENEEHLNHLLKMMYGDEISIDTLKVTTLVYIYALAHRLNVQTIMNVLAENFADLSLHSETDLVETVTIAYMEMPKENNALRKVLLEEVMSMVDIYHWSDCKEWLAPAIETSGTFALELMAGIADQQIQI